MKRLILLLCTICTMPIFASNDSIQDAIRQNLLQLDSAYKSLKNSKKDDKIKVLKTQIEEYKEWIVLLQKDNQELRNELSAFPKKEEQTSPLMLCLSESIDVFTQALPVDAEIPAPLMPHMTLIRKIREAKTMVDVIQNKITEIQNKGLERYGVDTKSIIAKEIEYDLSALDILLTEIERMDLNSLSEVQKQYFKPGMTEQYNSFLKYFE